MVYKGRAPKNEAERINRNAPAFTPTEVEESGEIIGPDLPKGYYWCPRTKEWWDNFRASPHAQLCVTDMDWEFMLDTARLHNECWRRRTGKEKPLGATSLAELSAQIRVRMERFGGDPVSRQKLRMTIKPRRPVAAEAEVIDAEWHDGPAPAPVATPDYRKMLGSESEGGS